MSGAYDMRLIARYFGRVASQNAAAALKNAVPIPPAEAHFGTQAARELRGNQRTTNSAQTVFHMLEKMSMHVFSPGTHQLRSVSTGAAHAEALSPFDLQRFGKATPAVEAALSRR